MSHRVKSLIGANIVMFSLTLVGANKLCLNGTKPLTEPKRTYRQSDP